MGSSGFVVPAPETAAALGVVACEVIPLLAGRMAASWGAPIQAGLEHRLIAAAAQRRARGRCLVQPPKGQVHARRAADRVPAHVLAARHLRRWRCAHQLECFKGRVSARNFVRRLQQPVSLTELPEYWLLAALII